MYLVYKRKDNVIEDCIYRETCNGNIEIAIEGDFRKGYITYSKEKFEEFFLSCSIKVLKQKPKHR